MNNRVLLIVFLVVLLVSLVPSALRTAIWISNGHSLATIFMLEKEEYSVNPYDEFGMLIPQQTAFWILKNFDYPYRECEPEAGFECVPLLNFVGASLKSSEVSREKRLRMLQLLMERDIDLNSRNSGLTAMQEAILFCDIDYLELLLNAGANPFSKSIRPADRTHNLDSFEFLKHLELNTKNFDCEEAATTLYRYEYKS